MVGMMKTKHRTRGDLPVRSDGEGCTWHDLELYLDSILGHYDFGEPERVNGNLNSLILILGLDRQSLDDTFLGRLRRAVNVFIMDSEDETSTRAQGLFRDLYEELRVENAVRV